MATAEAAGTSTQRISLLRVLGPAHVWALGVGIVLVGEFMGWNFSVGKGGAIGSLIACWVIGLLYTCVAMIDSEVTSTVAAAGGQYAQAKHIMGPLMAFNVGLYLVMAYTMLEAADALVAGDLISTVAGETGHSGLSTQPFVVLTIAALASFQFGIWYYLGIEGTCQAAEEVRSPARYLRWRRPCVVRKGQAVRR